MAASIAMALLPMLPQIVDSTIKVAQIVRDLHGTPEEAKAQLDQITKDLQGIVAQVVATELPK